MNPRYFWLTVLAGSFFSILSLCLLSFPLGVPGEWTWVRIGYDEPGRWADLTLNLMILLPVGLGWLALVRWGARRITQASRLPRSLLLAGLTGGSFLLVAVLQSLQPAPYPQLKSWVLFYQQSSGYFHVARYEMQDVADFLSGYEDRMAEGDVYHIGTHPPGLFLLHRMLWKCCEQSPALTNGLLATTPAAVSGAFDVLNDNLAGSGTVFSRTERASLWLAMILTQTVAVATVVPLYLLLVRYVTRDAAWLAAACWPLVPSLSVFLPKSDALYPFLGMLFLWLWVSSGTPGQWWRACFAGLVFWVGVLLSLAIVPVGLIAGLDSVLNWFGRDKATEGQSESQNVRRRHILLTIGWSVAAFLLATCALWLFCNINLFSVWLWNYHNHARFYEEVTRTAWKWCLVNPLETFFALGAPLAVTGVWGACGLKTSPLPFRRLIGSCLLVWALIWISGKNSGEAARLWLVFFPIVCLPAAVCFSALKDESDLRRSWTVRLLALQLALCAVTVATVSGFHVPSALPDEGVDRGERVAAAG